MLSLAFFGFSERFGVAATAATANQQQTTAEASVRPLPRYVRKHVLVCVLHVPPCAVFVYQLD
jgi:hypothetical protein